MKTKFTRMTSILLAALFLFAVVPLQVVALDNGGTGGTDASELQWICVSGTHSWNSGEITTAATCEGLGEKTYTCTLCGATRTENIEALGHSWDDGEITTAPTCGATGVKTYTCQNDGTHTKTETIPATGAHTWGEWEVTTAATCAADGERSRTCSVCGTVEHETIPMTGHTMEAHAAVDADCDTAGNSAYWYCSACNKYFSDAEGETEIEEDSWIISELGHVWVEWQEGDDIADFTLKTAATTESAAVYYKNCSRCGESAEGIDESETFTYGEQLPYEPDIVYGDVNGDGDITLADLTLLSRYFVNNTIPVSDGADVNGKEGVTLADLTLLSRYFVNNSIPLGPQE